MIAKKCDRCGALYEVYNTEKDRKKGNGIMILNIDENGGYWENGALDFCPECAKKFYEFLNGPGVWK